MKIHEYQAKSLLKEYNIPIQDGYTVDNTSDIEKTLKKVGNDFNTTDFVVKAQIALLTAKIADAESAATPSANRVIKEIPRKIHNDQKPLRFALN